MKITDPLPLMSVVLYEEEGEGEKIRIFWTRDFPDPYFKNKSEDS